MGHKTKVELADEIYADYKEGFAEWSDAFGIIDRVLEWREEGELIDKVTYK
jgi:hypothetical protein